MSRRHAHISYVNYKGEKIDWASVASHRSPETTKPQIGIASSYHRGWRVEGHMPGALEAAERLAQEACYKWSVMLPDERNQAIRKGVR